jgi:hypothetical protein
MIGAIAILIIAVIFGIIYGRDAIDTSYRKRPNEGVVESIAEDVKLYYHEDPKRLAKLIIFFISIAAFVITLVYWVLTRTEILKMIGLGQ